jgi:F-type H+-transporting ATPase subunit b
MEVIPSLPLALLMVVPFLVTFVALRSILFKPLLEYLMEREAVVVQAKHDTEALTGQIASRMSSLEVKLSDARDEVASVRTAARQRAQEQQGAIIGKARAEADTLVRQAVAEIGVEREKGAATMRDTAAGLSREIASRVLGRQLT